MSRNISKLLQIDGYSAIPKYLQVVNSILRVLKEGEIKKNDILPSINELSYELDIARVTVERAYKHLKKIGVIESVPGKGFYIKNDELNQRYKIILIFNKLSAHKKIIYDAFADILKDVADIDFYIYNNDYNLFKSLVLQKKEDCTHLVIIPHFYEGGENAHEIINSIPKEKLILLDKKLPGVTGDYATVFENFENDLFTALEQAQPQLSKYQVLKLIFPKYSYYPNEIRTGFVRFCYQYAYDYRVVHDIGEEEIQPGDAFINVMEDDLVVLIEKIISKQLEVGKDIGIISYNETPIKKIILKGITTISTDFHKMGELAANLILEGSKKQLEVPFKLTLRQSL
jgi:DNA-binding transcriptional regulator YhcF (GntR family)